MNRVAFLEKLISFLDNVKESKKEYVMENVDALYELSKKGENRAWGGIQSDNNDYYYKRISDMQFKEKFDAYIDSKLLEPEYDILKRKYFNG